MVNLDCQVNWIWNQLKDKPLDRSYRHFQKGFTKESPSPSVGSTSSRQLRNKQAQRESRAACLPPLLAGECVYPLMMTLSTLANSKLQSLGPFNRLKTSGPQESSSLHHYVDNAALSSHMDWVATKFSASTAYRHLCWTAQPFCVSRSNRSPFITYIHNVGFILLENPSKIPDAQEQISGTSLTPNFKSFTTSIGRMDTKLPMHELSRDMLKLYKNHGTRGIPSISRFSKQLDLSFSIKWSWIFKRLWHMTFFLFKCSLY